MGTMIQQTKIGESVQAVYVWNDRLSCVEVSTDIGRGKVMEEAS